MESSLADEVKTSNRIKIDLSFEYKADRNIEVIKDLASRQMVMKIFEYFDDPFYL